MFEIKRYTGADADEWNVFVAASKNGTFLFDRSYMDYHSDRFADYSLLIRDAEGRLYAVLPANRVGDTLYSHQGLSYGGLIMSERCTTEAVCQLFAELNAALRDDGIRRVVYKAVPWIYHRLPAEEDLYALFLICKARLTMRLVSSVVVQGRGVAWKRDRRYAANKAQTNGIVVSRGDDYETFWQLLADNLMERFSAKPVHSLAEIRLLHSRFPESIQLWEARSPNGTLLAGTVLYVTPCAVHSQYTSASPEGKHTHAVDALYCHILRKAYPHIPYIDLGTSNIPGGSKLHASLIYQKEGFGGRAVCYDTYEWEL